MRGLPNVTYCTLIRQSSGNCGRHAKQHAFLYHLWTTGALLNILLGPPNHDSQNSPDETHELGSWAESEMLCHKLELWALMRLYRHEFWTMGFNVILWIWTLLGFKRDFSKIHDNIDVVQVTNGIKPCDVKNLSSTFSLSSAWACFARACLARACFARACTSEDVSWRLRKWANLMLLTTRDDGW